MSQMKDQASRCVVIGDLVGSRGAPNRRALHRAVEKALVSANAAVPGVTELRITVGDEFQGAYATLGSAPSRRHCGCAWSCCPAPTCGSASAAGRCSCSTPSVASRTAPGWWAARAAIDAVEQAAGRPATRHLRTAYRPAPSSAADGPPAGRASGWPRRGCRQRGPALSGPSGWLVVDRSVRLLRGLMDPHTTQSELATLEGISASAVSQRVRADGIGAVLAAEDLLRGLA